MKLLQNTRRKLASSGVTPSEDLTNDNPLAHIAQRLKTNCNLIANGYRIMAIEGEPPVAQPAPRGVDVTTYFYQGKLFVYNKEGKKIPTSSLKVPKEV